MFVRIICLFFLIDICLASVTLYLWRLFFLFHLECRERERDLGFSQQPLTSLGGCGSKLLFLGCENISVQVGDPRKFSLVLLQVKYC